MNFIQVEDGTWVNLDHVVEMNVVDNSEPLLEDDKDSHCVLLTRMRLHEEITYILVTGTRGQCEQEVRHILERSDE